MTRSPRLCCNRCVASWFSLALQTVLNTSAAGEDKDDEGEEGSFRLRRREVLVRLKRRARDCWCVGMAQRPQEMLRLKCSVQTIHRPGLAQRKASLAKGHRRRRVVARLGSRDEKWLESGRAWQFSPSSAANGRRVICEAFDRDPESTGTEKKPSKSKKRRLKGIPVKIRVPLSRL